MIQNYFLIYEQWKTDTCFDEATRAEINALNPETDAKEIQERFYKELEFGSGGLRGIMGAGTNRMNKYTVGKASAGLGRFLLNNYSVEECVNRGVVVAYDTRNHSREFAHITADVLSGMGIKVYLQEKACPTPQLSFSVKHFNALVGVVITASHNTKEYNGYKVYDEYGCQLVPNQAKQVIEFVNGVGDYCNIVFEGNPALIQTIDTTNEFVEAVLRESRYVGEKDDLHVVYTPLHGTGRIPVLYTLKKAGFNHIDVVPQQADEDGDFPTVESPNPEDRHALELGIQQATRCGADIVLGTDPDSDRVGVAVRTDKGYQLLTGNQVGALLVDFVLEHTDVSKYKKPAVIKTVVSSELGAEIAKKHGLTVFSTLTGFKFIGEKITQFENAFKNSVFEQEYTFVVGYEESYGYLVGLHARDKDAVVSSLLICEMAAEYKKRAKTLFDRLNELYNEFGYYCDDMDSFTLEGKDGLERITSIMDDFKKNGSPFDETEQIIDYNESVDAEPGFGKLPVSNVLKYILTDGSWMAIRPSGTEPKIKIYYSIKGMNKAEAEAKLDVIRKRIIGILGL